MKKQNKFLFLILSLFLASFVSSDLVAMKRKRPDDDKDTNPKKHKIRRVAGKKPQRRPVQLEYASSASSESEDEREEIIERIEEREGERGETVVEEGDEREDGREEDEQRAISPFPIPDDFEFPFVQEIDAFNFLEPFSQDDLDDEIITEEFAAPIEFEQIPEPEEQPALTTQPIQQQHVTPQQLLEQQRLILQQMMQNQLQQQQLAQVFPVQPPHFPTAPAPPRVGIISVLIDAVEITVHSSGAIDIQAKEEAIPPKAKNTQDQIQNQPQDKTQDGELPDQKPKQLPFKKRKLYTSKKTLTDLSCDSLTQIILFMLSPEKNEQRVVNIPKIMTHLRLICRQFNTTIEYICKHNQLIRSIVQYVYTYKVLLSRPALHLYLKLNDIRFDLQDNPDPRVTFVVPTNDLRIFDLADLLLLFAKQLQESRSKPNEKPNSNVQLRLNTIKKLLEFFISKRFHHYQALHEDRNYEDSEAFRMNYLVPGFEQLLVALEFVGSHGDAESAEWLVNLLEQRTDGNQPRWDLGLHTTSPSNLQCTYGKIVVQAANNGHEEIALSFAKKTPGRIAQVLRILNNLKEITNKEIRQKIIDVIKEDIERLPRVETRDSKVAKRKKRRDLREQIGSLFTIGAQINDSNLMKEIVKQHKQHIHPQYFTNALYAAIENESKEATRYLTKKYNRKKSIVAIRASDGKENYIAEDLLRLAAERNFVRVIKYLAKSKKITKSILPELMPELLVIATTHGSLDIVRYLCEEVMTPNNYKHDLMVQPPRNRTKVGKKIRRLKLTTISLITMVLHIAAQKGSQAETDEEKEKYEQIIAYLLSRNEEPRDTVNFMTHAATTPVPEKKKKKKKKKKRKRKEKTPDSDVEMEDPEEEENEYASDGFIIRAESHRDDDEFEPSGSEEDEEFGDYVVDE